MIFKLLPFVKILVQVVSGAVDNSKIFVCLHAPDKIIIESTKRITTNDATDLFYSSSCMMALCEKWDPDYT